MAAGLTSRRSLCMLALASEPLPLISPTRLWASSTCLPWFVERACVTPLLPFFQTQWKGTHLMSPQLLPSVRHGNEKEDGTTPAEYAVILALVMVACVAAVTILCGR